MDRAIVGIIIAAYNAEETLARALDSVLEQTCESWQAVVVDDGSTDRTFEVASSYAVSDSRVTVVSQENKGEAAARNAALPLLSTEWVVYLDSDDSFAPNHLQRQLEFAGENLGFDVYACNGNMIVSDGSRTLFSDIAEPVEITFESLLLKFVIMGGGSLLPLKVLREYDGFNEEAYTPDFDLWLRMLVDDKRIIMNPEVLYNYYVGHASNKTSSTEKTILASIMVLDDIMHTKSLSVKQIAIVRQAIEKRYETIERYREHLRMLAQREAILVRIEALFGKRIANILIRFGRRWSRYLMPLRKAMIRVAGR